MNVLWKVFRGETNLRQEYINSFLFSERLLQSAAARHCKNYFLSKLQEAPHLTAMWPLGLGFHAYVAS